jgi:hypothetical protein
MIDLPEQFEFPLTLRVPRTAFVVVAPEPATVNQKTAEQHFGIPPRLFKRMVREGLFPVKKIGRLIFAAYDDVKRAVTEGAVARSRVEKAVEAAIAEPEKAAPMSIEAARTYFESARTPRERRERKREIEATAWKLWRTYDEKLADGSPNPKYDKALVDHGTGLLLVLASSPVRRATTTKR